MRLLTCLISTFLLFVMNGRADDIDFEVHSGIVLKMIREMTSKTNASDSLNLPANATSIRENITDTFSCENRTYGYYADVDNECQVFHVCLPSQAPSGRNITYKWSFICPAETIFNQEVLVCTRPIDAIACEDSEEYYYVNMEIGKVPPKNDSKSETPQNEDATKNKPDRNPQKRRPDNRKQNIILDNLFKDIDTEMKEKLQNVDLENVGEIFPGIIVDEGKETEDFEERMALERRSVGAKRFRFKSDV